MAKSDGLYPAPVYVATFADGTVARMSYYSKRGKPLDQDGGRRMVCQTIGNERARARQITPTHPEYFSSVEYRRLLRGIAQALIDESCDLVFGAMPMRRKRYMACLSHHKHGDGCWKVATIGSASVPLFRTFLPAPAPAVDIIAGHTERKDTGEIIPDPVFESGVVDLAAKRRTKTNLEKALALLAKLSPADRATLAGRLAA